MSVYNRILEVRTKGENHIINITERIMGLVKECGIQNGICTVFCKGSTGAVTTIEYEDGLLRDFPEAMERIAPKNAVYEHHLRWGDGNGHSHVRASVLGPSLTIPINNGQLMLGTWQQVAFVEFDIHPRNRSLIVTIIGE